MGAVKDAVMEGAFSDVEPDPDPAREVGQEDHDDRREDGVADDAGLDAGAPGDLVDPTFPEDHGTDIGGDA